MGPRARLEKIRGARYKGKCRYHRAHHHNVIDGFKWRIVCDRFVRVARSTGAQQMLENRQQGREAGDDDGVHCEDDKKRRHSWHATEHNYDIQLLVSIDTFRRGILRRRLHVFVLDVTARSGLGCDGGKGGGGDLFFRVYCGILVLITKCEYAYWCRRHFEPVSAVN
jgi:hypothetical protein